MSGRICQQAATTPLCAAFSLQDAVLCCRYTLCSSLRTNFLLPCLTSPHPAAASVPPLGPTSHTSQPLIPVLLLVLGSNLSDGPRLASGQHLPIANVSGVIGTKLILMPLLGLAAVTAAEKVGLIPPGTDPLAILVMMVAWATPTAILVHSLASVHHNGEDEVSALLFYEYLAAMATLPVCSAVYLYMLGACIPHVA